MSTKNKSQPKTNVNQKQMSTKNKCQPKTNFTKNKSQPKTKVNQKQKLTKNKCQPKTTQSCFSSDFQKIGHGILVNVLAH